GTKTKELLGLVASAVLRCDDCITYHLVRCGEEGWKRDEVIDALNVALLVGGAITIPHVRRAFARMREIGGVQRGEVNLERFIEGSQERVVSNAAISQPGRLGKRRRHCSVEALSHLVLLSP